MAGEEGLVGSLRPTGWRAPSPSEGVEVPSGLALAPATVGSVEQSGSCWPAAGQGGRGSRLALASWRWWGGSLEMTAADRRVLRKPAPHLESLEFPAENRRVSREVAAVSGSLGMLAANWGGPRDADEAPWEQEDPGDGGLTLQVALADEAPREQEGLEEAGDQLGEGPWGSRGRWEWWGSLELRTGLGGGS